MSGTGCRPSSTAGSVQTVAKALTALRLLVAGEGEEGGAVPDEGASTSSESACQ